MKKKLKNLLIFSVLISLILTACSSNEVVNQPKIRVSKFNTEIALELQPALKHMGKMEFSDETIAQTRQVINGFLISGEQVKPAVEDVVIRELYIEGPKNSPDVKVRIYEPEETKDGDLAGFLWIHGGGLIVGVPEIDDNKMKKIVKETGTIVVSVDYRVAPESKYPAAIEDCYVSLKWMYDNAEELGIDNTRIGIGGASAGGGLAASLALMARDRDEVNVKLQVLVYPMIDDKNIAQASDTIPDANMWSRANNLYGWTSYLNVPAGTRNVSQYAAAARAKTLRGLPKTFMAVGDADLFYEEDVTYAKRLKKAGVSTEFHVYKGAFHGFDSFQTAMGKDFDIKMINAIKNGLN